MNVMCEPLLHADSLMMHSLEISIKLLTTEVTQNAIPYTKSILDPKVC